MAKLNHHRNYELFLKYFLSPLENIFPGSRWVQLPMNRVPSAPLYYTSACRVSAAEEAGAEHQTLQPHLDQAGEAARSKHLCSRGRLAVCAAVASGLRKVIQGIAVAAEGNWVDEAGGQKGEGHALEEPSELRRHRQGESFSCCRHLMFPQGGCRSKAPHPFAAIRSGHAVKHPLVFRLGLQSHLRKETRSVIKGDISVFMAWSVTQPSRCPVGVQPLSPQHLHSGGNTKWNTSV